MELQCLLNNVEQYGRTGQPVASHYKVLVRGNLWPGKKKVPKLVLFPVGPRVPRSCERESSCVAACACQGKSFELFFTCGTQSICVGGCKLKSNRRVVRGNPWPQTYGSFYALTLNREYCATLRAGGLTSSMTQRPTVATLPKDIVTLSQGTSREVLSAKRKQSRPSPFAPAPLHRLAASLQVGGFR
jgi:hypothetical protein